VNFLNDLKNFADAENYLSTYTKPVPAIVCPQADLISSGQLGEIASSLKMQHFANAAISSIVDGGASNYPSAGCEIEVKNDEYFELFHVGHNPLPNNADCTYRKVERVVGKEDQFKFYVSKNNDETEVIFTLSNITKKDGKVSLVFEANGYNDVNLLMYQPD
jgi:hypothetical protein